MSEFQHRQEEAFKFHFDEAKIEKKTAGKTSFQCSEVEADWRGNKPRMFPMLSVAMRQNDVYHTFGILLISNSTSGSLVFKGIRSDQTGLSWSLRDRVARSNIIQTSTKLWK